MNNRQTHQCSPQALLAYRADMPSVRKAYRPIRLRVKRYRKTHILMKEYREIRLWMEGNVDNHGSLGRVVDLIDIFIQIQIKSNNNQSNPNQIKSFFISNLSNPSKSNQIQIKSIQIKSKSNQITTLTLWRRVIIEQASQVSRFRAFPDHKSV